MPCRLGYTRGMKWGVLFCLALVACGKAGSSAPLAHPEFPGGGNVASAIAEADARAAAPGAAPSSSPAATPSAAKAPCPCAVAKPDETDSGTPERAVSDGSTTVGATPSTERASASAKNHRSKVKELFELMNMEKVMEVGIQEAINAQMQANPEMVKFKDIMLDFFSKHMSWKSVERGFIDDYMETFSQAEIEDMIAFYHTPTGKKTITTLPELMKRGSQHGLERVQQNMPELLRMIEQRLKGN